MRRTTWIVYSVAALLACGLAVAVVRDVLLVGVCVVAVLMAITWPAFFGRPLRKADLLFIAPGAIAGWALGRLGKDVLVPHFGPLVGVGLTVGLGVAIAFFCAAITYRIHVRRQPRRSTETHA